MRVETKYGQGTLLGLTTQGCICYKVLLDNPPLPLDEEELKEIRKTEDRIHLCLSVKVLSDDGKVVQFSGSQVRVI